MTEGNNMGNLGWYQLITTLAKKVGGPKVLLGLVAAGGYVIIRTAEAGGKKVVKLVKKKRESKIEETSLTTFIFTETGVGDGGLKYFEGESFFVAATHNDVILIEKENDKDNPYFVSGDWLKKVSTYM
ncbi:hypothetical protein ID741_002106 [Enterococcus sp. AZ103]